MITVKLLGLLGLEHGLRQTRLEAGQVAQVLSSLEALGIPRRKLGGCVIFVNGKPAKKKDVLHDGDVVVLMSPVAGG